MNLKRTTTILHPDQSRVLLRPFSPEGHISSITCRIGIVHPDQRIELISPTGFLTEPRQVPNPLYERALFGRKLAELGLTGEFTRRVMHKLGKWFALEELRAGLQAEQ